MNARMRAIALWLFIMICLVLLWAVTNHAHAHH